MDDFQALAALFPLNDALACRVFFLTELGFGVPSKAASGWEHQRP